MRRHLLFGVLALLLAMTAAPALATPDINPDTGKNLMAWQKPHTIWTIHLTGDSPAEQGQVQILETACHDGVGVRLFAPCVLEPTGGMMMVESGGDSFAIPIEDYQAMVGFLFVLDHWPSPWPVDPVYLDPETPSMPLFVEWDTLFGPGELTPAELFEALRVGNVTVELYGAGGQVLRGGTK